MHWNFESVRVAKNNLRIFKILFPLNISKYFSSAQPFSPQHHIKGTEDVILKELGKIKTRHWDLYVKPDASIGLIKKPQNVVISNTQKCFRTFSAYLSQKLVF